VGSAEDDLQPAKVAELRALTTQLLAENARLLRLLELTPKQAAPSGPAQTGLFETPPVRSISDRPDAVASSAKW
jgi:hypothetical protein